MMGISCGPVRRPLPDFPESERPALRDALTALGALEGEGLREARRPSRPTAAAPSAPSTATPSSTCGSRVTCARSSRAARRRSPGPATMLARAPTDNARPLGSVRLLAPLVPPVILNSGQNYWDHRDEKPEVDQKEPEFFLKTPFAVIGPDEPVLYDTIVTRKLDYEVELAVVIGKPGRHIPVEKRTRPRLWLHDRERRDRARPTSRSSSRRAAGSTRSAPGRTSTRPRRSAPGSSRATRSPTRRTSSFAPTSTTRYASRTRPRR